MDRHCPLWEIDRDSSRHKIQIEDHPRTGALMYLPAACSGAPHANMLCLLLLLISNLSLEFSFSIFSLSHFFHTQEAIVI
jgi:hypothetical protein